MQLLTIAYSCSFPAVHMLDLSACRMVTNAEVEALVQVTALRTLCLHGCEDVTDAGVAALAQLPRLASINLHNCCRVFPLHVIPFKELFPQACTLNPACRLSPTGHQHATRIAEQGPTASA